VTPTGPSWAAEELERLERQGLRRTPAVLSSGACPEVVLDGRSVLLLCSNNYLGLATDPRVVEAAAGAARRWGAGTGASRLVSGTTELHAALERDLAALKGCDDAVLFSSGYLANTGTIPALVGPGDLVCSDELNHASIVDACRLSGARREVYRHGDAADLERRLAAAPEARRLVVTDSVFSMEGDAAPLADLAAVCERWDAVLMVDEAHATGVLGPGGGGAVEALGLRGRVPVVMGTLSKALGSAGGFVAATEDVVSLLRNRARTHVFDTAPAAPAAAAAREAISIVRSDPNRRARVASLARQLHAGLGAMGYAVRAPAAAIVPLVVGEPAAALRLSAGLLERGVFAPAIRPPSVPPGTARLRLTVMATHTDEQVERALGSFAELRPPRPAGARRRPGAHAGPPDAGLGLHAAIVRAGGVFVTGTDTGVGKTVVAAAIARVLGERGITVAAMKPVQTGAAEGADDLGFVRRLVEPARLAQADQPDRAAVTRRGRGSVPGGLQLVDREHRRACYCDPRCPRRALTD
jgi:8-amino-7-oxononanoate synthase